MKLLTYYVIATRTLSYVWVVTRNLLFSDISPTFKCSNAIWSILYILCNYICGDVLFLCVSTRNKGYVTRKYRGTVWKQSYVCRIECWIWTKEDQHWPWLKLLVFSYRKASINSMINWIKITVKRSNRDGEYTKYFNQLIYQSLSKTLKWDTNEIKKLYPYTYIFSFYA